MYQNASINHKLVATIGSALAVMGVVVVIIISSFLQSDYERHLKQLLSSRSETALRHFNYTYEKAMSNAAMIFSKRDLALIFDGARPLSESHIATFRNRFSDLRSEQPFYQQVYVINHFGNVIYYDNGQLFYDMSFTQRLGGYALQANSSEGTMPQAHMLKHEGTWIWVLVLPVSYAGHSGYIVTVLDGEVIQGEVNQLHNVFVDFRGEDDAEVFSTMGEKMVSHRYSYSDGTPVFEVNEDLFHYAYQDTPYGTIYSWVNLSNADALNNDRLLKMFIYSVLALLLAACCIYFSLYRLVVKPVRQVKAWIDSALSRTLDEQDVDISTREFDEIGESLQQISMSLQHHNTYMERLAYYDDLTQLHNKQFVMSHLDNQMEKDLYQGRNLYAWVIDIKGFKRINSTHGHDVGDSVLKTVGARLRSATDTFCRHHDIEQGALLVSRGASDEFMIMGIVKAEGDMGDTLATVIQKTIESPLSVDGHVFNLHVVVGYARGAADPAELYQNADIARHEAKQTGVGVLRYTAALKHRTLQNQKMVDDINSALKEGQFMLHYQPKLNLGSGRSSTFEALIRWPKEDGFVSPGVFIPFAEDAGLIGDIDTYVMHKLIHDVRVLEDMGWRGFVISFNISARRLIDATFLRDMKAAIERKSVNPRHIQIEITEHSLIDNIAQSIVAIENLKSMGISVALDDFGTGHSSLAYLKDLPIDVLKVDRTFIKNVNNESQKKVLLSHIVKIGQSLCMTIVAEGVETREEYDIIKELGCEELQGYYFNKPMPLPTMIDLFAKDNVA